MPEIYQYRMVSKPNQKKIIKASHSYSWARAVNGEGREYQAWLKLGEGYHFTAFSSVLAVEKVLREKIFGALTPVQAFGINFVTEIPGVSFLKQIPKNNTP